MQNTQNQRKKTENSKMLRQLTEQLSDKSEFLHASK